MEHEENIGPSLLVSVRNANEAGLLDGCCEIIDVKEPGNGPLGKADDTVIAAVAQVMPQTAKMSVALGELSQVTNQVSIPPRASYLKLGLANVGPDWVGTWMKVRGRIEESLSSAPQWVAVAYADHDAAKAPAVNEVLEAAVESGCRVLLVDTFGKMPGRSVFDSLSISQLSTFRERCDATGLQFALAGQLRIQHAANIREVRPHIVGIRGAACRSGDRVASIDSGRVRKFKDAICANLSDVHRV